MSVDDLRAKIREVPDFPKPGILFYDITTLLKEPAAYKEAIDLMTAPFVDTKVDIVVGLGHDGDRDPHARSQAARHILPQPA